MYSCLVHTISRKAMLNLRILCWKTHFHQFYVKTFRALLDMTLFSVKKNCMNKISTIYLAKAVINKKLWQGERAQKFVYEFKVFKISTITILLF